MVIPPFVVYGIPVPWLREYRANTLVFTVVRGLLTIIIHSGWRLVCAQMTRFLVLRVTSLPPGIAGRSSVNFRWFSDRDVYCRLFKENECRMRTFVADKLVSRYPETFLRETNSTGQIYFPRKNLMYRESLSDFSGCTMATFLTWQISSPQKNSKCCKILKDSNEWTWQNLLLEQLISNVSCPIGFPQVHFRKTGNRGKNLSDTYVHIPSI